MGGFGSIAVLYTTADMSWKAAEGIWPEYIDVVQLAGEFYPPVVLCSSKSEMIKVNL